MLQRYQDSLECFKYVWNNIPDETRERLRADIILYHGTLAYYELGEFSLALNRIDEFLRFNQTSYLALGVKGLILNQYHLKHF